MKEKVLLSWSGGKDSCMALYEIQQSKDYEVTALLTTVTGEYDRISMHGVRRELLVRQAKSLGLALHQVIVSKGASNEEYESKMNEAFSMFSEQGIASVAFGDLFLQEIKEYRERFFEQIGRRCLFPVWRQNTSAFIRRFIRLGFKAVVTCVDPKALDGSFAGKIIDEEFLSRLPANVDPCGENGEFHSFVFDGPNFTEEVKIKPGEIVLRDGFTFCDLLPG
jgi:uncharacterized protein (TIGR00290 family)